MKRPRSNAFNEQIYAEAGEWFIACRSGALDDDLRRRFDAWLRRSPQHLSAYLELAAIWNEGATLDVGQRWDADTLIREAREDRGNVVSLAAVPNDTRSQTFSMRTRWLATAAAAVAASVLIALSWNSHRTPVYATEVGEQRSIVLSDGSTIELNSRSRVRVRFSDEQRSLELIEGQALFRVAKNPMRPFVVTADTTKVRAIGTQFDVNKRREGTVVTVVEGQVSVLTDIADARIDPATTVEASAPSLLLAAGEQVTVTDAAPKPVVRPNIERTIAWTQRQLVFEAATLSEVADEFNRHNQRQLIVRDPELYEFHISGVFASTDPESLLQFLRERAGVQVVQTDDAIYLMKKPSVPVTDR